MTLNFDKRYYSYDAVQAEFDFREKNDILHDDRGTDVWWDAQRSVSADDVPSYYNDFFDAERYYAIDTVVAKETPQQYHIGDDEYTFIKPNDELRRAAWSMDGKPYTLSHPSDGVVRSTDEIHGFWGQPRHDSDEQESRATLYFPTHDAEAREFVADHDNVSVGFVNTLVASDRDGIDAEQTDIYYDHIASVQNGRCSDEDGCGLQGFANGTDSAEYVSASTIVVEDMKGATNVSHPDSSMSNDSITNDRYRQSGTVYMIAPSEHAGNDTPLYPVSDCSDVRDAWYLQDESSLIDGVSLSQRIKMRANELGCQNMPWMNDSITTDVSEDYTIQPMTCDCGGDTTDGLDIGLTDFGVRKVREENDAVDEELSSKEQRIEELEGELDDASSAKDLLDSASDELDADNGDELLTEIRSLQDDYEDVREEMESYRTDERDDLLTELKERTDSEYHDDFTQDDDESVTEHIARLEDKLETVKMVKGDSSPTTVTPDRGTTTDSTSTEHESSQHGAEVDTSQFADIQF